MKDVTLPQKVLFLSDAHIGGAPSNFAAYQAGIIELMSRYDHVVMIGDMWELFFVDSRNHIDTLSNLLEVLTGKGSKKWRKEFNDKNFRRSGVENVIYGAEWFTVEFLECFPKVHLHVVGGNHESVRHFHNVFTKIQERYPGQFEWSAEAIRIGDALATHGHLPLKGLTVEEFPIVRLRDAESDEKWQRFIRLGYWVSHRIEGYWENSAIKSHAMKPAEKIRRIHKQFKDWGENNGFLISHSGSQEPISLDGIKHIFIGHTHHRYDNLKYEGIANHNTGAIVYTTSQTPEDLGILEADLNADGTITNVRRVENILKDKDVNSRRRPPEYSR